MLCPLCARALRPVERQGVEIDHCANCGGLWLDQGELNELIRREARLAIEKGQEMLLAARSDREYDRPVRIDGDYNFALSRNSEDRVSSR